MKKSDQGGIEIRAQDVKVSVESEEEKKSDQGGIEMSVGNIRHQPELRAVREEIRPRWD